jgi:hypothetical protein
VNGVCASLGEVGAPCGANAGICDATKAFCISGICQAIPSASPGQACSPPAVTCYPSVPCEAGVCNLVDPATCSAPPDAGGGG